MQPLRASHQTLISLFCFTASPQVLHAEERQAGARSHAGFNREVSQILYGLECPERGEESRSLHVTSGNSYQESVGEFPVRGNGAARGTLSEMG